MKKSTQSRLTEAEAICGLRFGKPTKWRRRGRRNTSVECINSFSMIIERIFSVVFHLHKLLSNPIVYAVYVGHSAKCSRQIFPYMPELTDLHHTNYNI